MSATARARRARARTLLVVIPLAVIGIVLVAAVVLWISLVRFIHPVDSGPLDDRCAALRLGSVNSFVYASRGSAIAIDTGSSPDRAAVAFGSAGIDPGRVAAVFLTHADADHAGGAALFRRATFYMGEGEGDLLSGKTRRRLFGIPSRVTFGHQWTPVSNGMVISVGSISVAAIHVPGHTPGSTAYLVDGTHLFTGDLLVLTDGRAVVSPMVFNNNGEESARSLRALARQVSGKGLSLIATAHGGISRDPDAALAEWR